MCVNSGLTLLSTIFQSYHDGVEFMKESYISFSSFEVRLA